MACRLRPRVDVIWTPGGLPLQATPLGRDEGITIREPAFPGPLGLAERNSPVWEAEGTALALRADPAPASTPGWLLPPRQDQALQPLVCEGHSVLRQNGGAIRPPV